MRMLLLFGALLAMPLQAAVVQLADGKLQGTYSNNVYSFKGVPYAAPPLGELRWSPPAPVEAWPGTLDATRHGPECVQIPYPEGSPFFHPLEVISEDCLRLAVYSAELSPAQPMPVMVWIHGGSFTRGAGSNAIYDGTHIAQRGVVLVSINYRLNIFGNLAHPELTREQGGTSGNYGLLDQVAALEWVRDNIARFGGDPETVTIFGESAGSSAVNQLVLTPLASGLFHRAIGQSGGFLKPQPTLQEAEASGLEVAQLAGAKDLAALRRLPASELTKLFASAEEQELVVRPFFDGKVIPDQPLLLMQSGRINRVPTLLGYNKDEATAFAAYPNMPFIYSNHEEFQEGLSENFGLAAYPFLWAYPEVPGSRQPYMDFFRDLVFGWDMNTWAALNEEAGAASYLYFYSHVPSNKDGEELGAYHASEIAYVFGNRVPEEKLDQSVHEIVSKYWLNFARHGDPNSNDLPDWPRHGVEEYYLHLNANPVVGESLDPWRMWLWNLAFSQ